MPHRVLLVDDEVHILRAAEFKFKRAGYVVQCAANGEQAWQIILAQCPDILITDYQMPKLDGLGLIERVRANEATAHLPVIMLTAKGFHLSDEKMTEQWDVAKVMSKPFSPRQLLALVERILTPEQTEHKPAPLESPAPQ